MSAVSDTINEGEASKELQDRYAMLKTHAEIEYGIEWDKDLW